jgi:hypothetical protein
MILSLVLTKLCDFQGTNAILIGLDRKDPTTLFSPVMMLMIRSLSFKIFMPLLPKDTCLVCLCMSETIRDQDFVAEEHNMQLLESLGGLAHLICSCHQTPLAPSPRSKEDKKKCMMCHRKEKYICCNIHCSLWLHGECFNQYPNDEITITKPVIEPPDP